MSDSIGGANQRAVIDDHGERRMDLADNGQGEIVAASGDDHDFDAPVRGFGNGGLIGWGNLPATVEERAVDVEGNKANCHRSSVPKICRGDVVARRYPREKRTPKWLC